MKQQSEGKQVDFLANELVQYLRDMTAFTLKSNICEQEICPHNVQSESSIQAKARAEFGFQLTVQIPKLSV